MVLPWARMPVTGLFAGDLNIRELFLDNLLDAIGTPNGGFIAQLTHQDDQIALPAHRFPKFLHVHDPGLDGLGTTIHNTLRQVRGLAVDIHQGLAGFDDGLGHRSGCRGIHRKDDHGIHSLSQEVFDLADLLGGVIGRIDNGEFDIGVGTGPLGHGIPDIGQPHIVEQGHGNPDLDLGLGGLGQEYCPAAIATMAMAGTKTFASFISFMFFLILGDCSATQSG